MDWSILTSILASGSVVYLIVERLFDRAKDKAEATKVKTEAVGDAIPLYRDIREIVKAEVEPLKAELEYLKEHYCCYREECEMRLQFKPHSEDGKF